MATTNAKQATWDEGWKRYREAHKRLETGEPADAMRMAREAVAIQPANSMTHSYLLAMLGYVPGMTAVQVVQEHRQWADKFCENVKSVFPLREHENDRNPNRLLRVGWVSPNLNVTPIGRFMLPIFCESSQTQSGLSHYVYSYTQHEDVISERIKRHVKWRPVSRLDDDRVAQVIQNDGIDILVDLTMHCWGNRLGIFLRKPAPVQVSYLAYPGTMGMEAIEYRITDRHLDPEPPVGAIDFIEKKAFVDHYWCYKASIYEVEPAAPPSIKNGYVTFGCLNSFCKVNPVVRATWKELMRQVEGSRLLVHAGEGEHRAKLIDEFSQANIDADRIRFVPSLGLSEYTRMYNEIDICLDPFPYAGGTTTCDALWMGVPVVTLGGGELPSSRGGVSILSAIAADELIASSPTHYIGIAAGLADSRERIERYRSTIRHKLLASPLSDAAAFTRSMENAFRLMWRTWCSRGSR